MQAEGTQAEGTQAADDAKSGQGYRLSKDFVDTADRLNVAADVTKSDKKRRSNLGSRISRHPGYAISLLQPLAGREDLRMTEADRPYSPGETARTAQGGLVVRLQLRHAQPLQTAKTDRATTDINSRGESPPEIIPGPKRAANKRPKRVPPLNQTDF